MFRMSFDRSMFENVKKRLTICVHVYTNSSLCTQFAFIHAQPGFIRTQTYSCVHISVLQFIRTLFPTYVHVLSAYVRRHGPACACHQSRTLF